MAELFDFNKEQNWIKNKYDPTNAKQQANLKLKAAEKGYTNDYLQNAFSYAGVDAPSFIDDNSSSQYDTGLANINAASGVQNNNAYNYNSDNNTYLNNLYQNETGADFSGDANNFYSRALTSGESRENVQGALNNSSTGQGYDGYVAPAPSLTGAQAHGYPSANVSPTSYQANQVDLNDVKQYDAANADSEGYEAAQYQVGDNDLVSNQLTGLLDRDSAYMRQARADGMRVAAQRGLLNTSMAGEAAQAAAIRAGLPIAQADANTNWQTGLTNTNASNRSREFGAGASNTAELSNAGFDNAALSQYTNSFNNQQAVNQSAENQQLQFGANAANAAATTNANAANTASQFTASSENAASITNAANELNLVLSTMKNDANLAALGLEALQIGFNNGVFNTDEDLAGYIKAVQIFAPEVANSMVGQMADEASADIL